MDLCLWTEWSELELELNFRCCMDFIYPCVRVEHIEEMGWMFEFVHPSLWNFAEISELKITVKCRNQFFYWRHPKEGREAEGWEVKVPASRSQSFGFVWRNFLVRKAVSILRCTKSMREVHLCDRVVVWSEISKQFSKKKVNSGDAWKNSLASNFRRHPFPVPSSLPALKFSIALSAHANASIYSCFSMINSCSRATRSSTRLSGFSHTWLKVSGLKYSCIVSTICKAFINDVHVIKT